MRILIDFDGVLHSYVSGWKGATTIPDPPNEGAIEWLRTLIAHPKITPVIFTSRCSEFNSEKEGVSGVTMAKRAGDAIRRWLMLNGLSEDEIAALFFTSDKLPAVMTLDDRGVTFEGTFPSIEFIEDFKPWKPGDD